MWKSIVSHARQIDQLRKALATSRIAGAYLFSGPAGIGKRLTADAFAAALLCPHAEEHDQEACGRCPACQKFAASNHPDAFIMAPVLSERGAVQSIKIDDLRELVAKLQFHPLEARAKIAIIDGAERLLEAAANSLLKALEEPPPATHFVLITPSPQRLLPTIRSRCQQLAFSPLADREIARILVSAKSLPEAEALRIARLSGGSAGAALLLDPEFVEAVLGRFLPLSAHASSADIIEAAQAWKEIDAEHAPLVFDLLASWYRDILRSRAASFDRDLIHPEAARAAAACPESRALANLAAIDAARAAADTAANKQLLFEQLLFTVTAN
jgi:DNA polymerase III subunit delta'